jgi:hypothetical protein
VTNVDVAVEVAVGETGEVAVEEEGLWVARG